MGVAGAEPLRNDPQGDRPLLFAPERLPSLLVTNRAHAEPFLNARAHEDDLKRKLRQLLRTTAQKVRLKMGAPSLVFGSKLCKRSARFFGSNNCTAALILGCKPRVLAMVTPEFLVARAAALPLGSTGQEAADVDGIAEVKTGHGISHCGPFS